MLLIHRSIHCKSQFAIVSVALGAFNVKWRSDCYQVLYRVWLNVVPSTCMVAPIKVQIVLQVHLVHVWYLYGTRMALGPRMVAIRRSDCPKQVASSCLLPWELPACQCQWSHHQLCSTALFLSEQPALALVLTASKYKYTNTQRHKYIRS